VKSPRVLECPIQLEAILERVHPFGVPEEFLLAIEMRILCAHIEDSLLIPNKPHYVDPKKWNPLIMSFCEFYELGRNVNTSRLAKIF